MEKDRLGFESRIHRMIWTGIDAVIGHFKSLILCFPGIRFLCSEDEPELGLCPHESESQSLKRQNQFFSCERLEAMATSLVVTNVSPSHFYSRRGNTAESSMSTTTDNLLCVHIYSCACRVKDNFGCHSEGTMGPRKVPVSTSPTLELQACATTLDIFMWPLGPELKSSYLEGNHFTN